MAGRRVRLARRSPTGRGEPVWAVVGYEWLEVHGVLDETEPTVDGKWKRLPFIAVWLLVDTRKMTPLGIPKRGWAVKGEYRLTDLRDWMDEHPDELARANAPENASA